MIMTNVFAFRATDPAVMKAEEDPVGPMNDQFLVSTWRTVSLTVACWGTHGTFRDRDKAVRALLPRLHALKLTKDGHPSHPLYLRQDLEPFLLP